MNTRPRSWINPEEACFVRLLNTSKNTDTSELAKFSSTEIPTFTETEAAPWFNEEISALMDARSGRQMVVVAATASVFAFGVVTMAVETGYDTFFVCDERPLNDEHMFARLHELGARIVLFDRFIEECRLATSDKSDIPKQRQRK